jgi:group I intron endonuclease
MYVYKITNTINGKVYIGKTTMPRVNDRWKDHRRKLRIGQHVNVHLQRAYNQYGIENFAYEVLEEHSCKEALLESEMVNIIRYRSCNRDFGYNMTFGGEGSEMTPEVRAKISKFASTRTGEKNPFFGKTHSPEVRQILSASSTGRVPSEKARQKMSKAGKGRKKTTEHNSKIGQALKGKPKSEQAKLNMKLAWKQRKLNKLNNS